LLVVDLFQVLESQLAHLPPQLVLFKPATVRRPLPDSVLSSSLLSLPWFCKSVISSDFLRVTNLMVGPMGRGENGVNRTFIWHFDFRHSAKSDERNKALLIWLDTYASP
jgi:hypothetical protein